MKGLIAQSDIKDLYPNDIGTIAYFRTITSSYVAEGKYNKLMSSERGKKVRFYKISDVTESLERLKSSKARYTLNENQLISVARIEATIERVLDLDR